MQIRFYSILILVFSFVSTQSLHAEQKIVSGTVLLNEQGSPDLQGIAEHLKSAWNLKISSVKTEGNTVVMDIGASTVMVAYLDYPAGKDYVQTSSAISWLWKTALQDTRHHKAQLVISVIGTSDKTLNLYKLFTKVSAGVLEKTRSVGVLMPDQLLILSKGYYLQAAGNMSDDNLPVYCWVYFGLMEENGKTGVFSYGLKDFGLMEVEVANSTRPLGEVQKLHYDVCTHLIRYNLHLKDGQSVPLDEAYKVKTSFGKPAYLEEEQCIQVSY